MTAWQYFGACLAAAVVVPLGWWVVARVRLLRAPEPVQGHGEGTLQVYVLAAIAQANDHERVPDESDFEFVRRVLERSPPLSAAPGSALGQMVRMPGD
jgi:hypothetical protein